MSTLGFLPKLYYLGIPNAKPICTMEPITPSEIDNFLRFGEYPAKNCKVKIGIFARVMAWFHVKR